VLGWLTPTAENVSSDDITRYHQVPGELMEFIAGALLLLTFEENWEQSVSGISPTDAANLFSKYLEDWYASE